MTVWSVNIVNMLNIILLVLLSCVCVVTPVPPATSAGVDRTVIDDIYTKCEARYCVGTSENNIIGTDCVEKSQCKILMTYQQDGSQHKFDLVVSDEYDYGFIAFSANNTMGGDGAVVCEKVNMTSTGVAKVSKAYLLENVTERLQDNTGVTVNQVVVVEEYIVCSFILNDTVEYDPNIPDITKAVVTLDGSEGFYLFAAYGPKNFSDDSFKEDVGCVMSDEKLFMNRITMTYSKCEPGVGTCVGTSYNDLVGTDCVENKNCVGLVAYEFTKYGRHRFHMFTKKDSDYVYVAFSDDYIMTGNDGGVICIHDKQVDVRKGYLVSINEPMELLEDDMQGLTVIHASVEDQYVTCSVELDKHVQYKQVDVSLDGDESYYMLMVYGEESDGKPEIPYGYALTKSRYFKTPEGEMKRAMYDSCSANTTDCVGGYVNRTRARGGCVEERDCDFLCVYEPPSGSDRPRFKLVTDVGNEYIALAFSDDQTLGGDSGVQCVPAATVKLQKVNILNGGQDLTLDPEGGFEDVIIRTYDSFSYCEFTMDRESKYEHQTISLSGPSEYYLIVATGGVRKSSSEQILGVDHHRGAAVSHKKLFNSSTVTIAASIVSYIVVTIVVFLFK